MIQSKADYREYLTADRIANHAPKRYKYNLLCRIEGGYNYLYLKYLRKVEYVLNCKKGVWAKIELKLLNIRLKKLSVMTGLSIPPNTFGKGLYIPHWGSIVINGSAHFGDYCVVQSGVNVSESVKGGNHLYLAAGAKILIGVTIADDVIIAANAVVNKDVTEPNIVVGGIPAKKISDKGFKNRDKV